MIIKILGKRYTTNRVPYNIAESSDGYKVGEIDYTSCIITLMESNRGAVCSEDSIRQSLWHEIVHGFCDAQGIKLKEPDIERFATALNVFFIDNPEFIKENYNE